VGKKIKIWFCTSAPNGSLPALEMLAMPFTYTESVKCHKLRGS
jgi:hypothetical protein